MAEKKRTAGEEHMMARYSVFECIKDIPTQRATLRDVIRFTGLVEIRAKRALKELVEKKSLVREGRFYCIKRGR